MNGTDLAPADVGDGEGIIEALQSKVSSVVGESRTRRGNITKIPFPY